MDYEKKYNEALERARALWQEAIEKEYVEDYLKDYETIFPELRESEDERVIKALETFINQPEVADKITFEARIEWLAWLEKQKEPKQTDLPAGFYYIDLDGNKYYSKEFRYGDMKVKVGEQKPTATINGEPIPTENQSVDIPLAEWSEEDEKMLSDLRNTLGCLMNAGAITFKTKKKFSDWLKSLRPRPKKELSIEKAIKWLDDTFYFLDNSSGRGRDCEITTHDFDSLGEMYDSFRKAVIVDCQPSWKPTEEQMNALNFAITYFMHKTNYKNPTELRDLYDDLLKLKQL